MRALLDFLKFQRLIYSAVEVLSRGLKQVAGIQRSVWAEAGKKYMPLFRA